jgi:hypothetical protein
MFEAPSRAATVRYASVRIGLGLRTGAEKPPDGVGRSGYADRLRGFAASDLALQESRAAATFEVG